ncbi:MAG TPA: hypothetical protein VKT27_05460 [Candidatus Binataceae bacterium]|nr:hypothetical protein [Candidatus Binataceae bacterium]
MRPIALRHTAAAGLLAAWYLLTPPYAPGNPPGPLRLDAPLSQWTRTDSTDSAAGCNEQRDNMVRMYQSADMTVTSTQFNLLLYHNSVCVSANDPRLRPAARQIAHRRSK